MDVRWQHEAPGCPDASCLLVPYTGASGGFPEPDAPPPRSRSGRVHRKRNAIPSRRHGAKRTDKVVVASDR